MAVALRLVVVAAVPRTAVMAVVRCIPVVVAADRSPASETDWHEALGGGEQCSGLKAVGCQRRMPAADILQDQSSLKAQGRKLHLNSCEPLDLVRSELLWMVQTNVV